MSHTILLVHGEARVRASARTALERGGYQVQETSRLVTTEMDGADLVIVAWTALNSVSESLAVLRSQDSTRRTRVITLAAREDMRSAIRTLEHGADDCVSVPFEHEELITRVNACLRRPTAEPVRERLCAGPVILDKAVHRVLVNEEHVDLAPTEFRLMTFFLENQGRVFSRAELLSRAWTKNIKAGHRTVDVHVRRLRQQLEPFGCEGMIQTVRGFGYRFSIEGMQTGAHAVSRFALPLSRS